MAQNGKLQGVSSTSKISQEGPRMGQSSCNAPQTLAHTRPQSDVFMTKTNMFCI